MTRRLREDGPLFIFTYYWRGRWPYTYEFDLSGSGCQQTIGWSKIAEEHTLDRGQVREYRKGFRLDASLSWDSDESMIRREYPDTDTYPGRTEKILQLLFNTPCTNNIFYFPYPSVHPNRYYDVRVIGDYNFTYIKGLTGFGLRGSMELTGKQVFDQIPFGG